jgi:hypothetical protein
MCSLVDLEAVKVFNKKQTNPQINKLKLMAGRSGFLSEYENGSSSVVWFYLLFG